MFRETKKRPRENEKANATAWGEGKLVPPPMKKHYRVYENGRVYTTVIRELPWPRPSPISQSAQKFVVRSLSKRGKWGKVPMELLNRVVRRSGLNIDQVGSLYRWSLIEKAKKCHSRVYRVAKTSRKKYESGQDILSLSHDYDLPPVAIFRSILSDRGMGKKKVKLVLKNPSKFLSSHDQNQLQRALDNDETQSAFRSQQSGQEFEDSIWKLLKTNGISCLTEDDLAKDQNHRYGKVVATPDFFLPDSIVIHGVRVRWIECKSFVGASYPMLEGDIYRQLERYVRYLGPGAIVFRYGYVEDFYVPPGVVRLDASFLKD